MKRDKGASTSLLKIRILMACNSITALARTIHEGSTAAADPGMSTALRSVGFLDVLSSTPAESFRRTPCSHARLRCLATNLHE